MRTLIYISFTILISYIIAVVWRWGLPWSVSQTFFDIKRKYIFSLVMFASFGLLLIPLIEALPSWAAIFGFLACAGGFLVGAAPNLNEQLEHKVHMSGAITLAICSQICVGILCFPILIGWLACAPLLIWGSRHFVFLVELIGGVFLYTSIILSL